MSEVSLETFAELCEISEVFLETLAGPCEVSEIFFETLTPSPTTLYHMIGCHKEGEWGVFNFLQIVTLSPFFGIVGPTIYRRLHKYKIKETSLSHSNDVSFVL